LTPNKLVFTLGSSYVCVNFGENRSRNATLRVPTDGHTHTLTDANRYHAMLELLWDRSQARTGVCNVQ